MSPAGYYYKAIHLTSQAQFMIEFLLLISSWNYTVMNERLDWLGCSVAVLTDQMSSPLTDYCRRFDQWLSPFWPKFFAVLTNACRRFDQCLSPFWLMVVAVLTRVVAVLTTVVAVLECRRFYVSSFLLSPFRCHGLSVYPVCVCNKVRLGQDTTWNRREHRLSVFRSELSLHHTGRV